VVKISEIIVAKYLKYYVYKCAKCNIVAGENF